MFIIQIEIVNMKNITKIIFECLFKNSSNFFFFPKRQISKYVIIKIEIINASGLYFILSIMLPVRRCLKLLDNPQPGHGILNILKKRHDLSPKTFRTMAMPKIKISVKKSFLDIIVLKKSLQDSFLSSSWIL